METYTARTDRPGRVYAVVGASLQLALGVAVGILRASNTSVGEQHVEGALPTLALAAVVAAPAVLAFLGLLIDRPVLYAAAGAACFPLIIISIAALPAVIPGALLLVAYVRATAVRPAAVGPTLAVIAVFVGLLIVAAVVIIDNTGTYSYTYPDGSGSEGGDYFLPRAAALGMGIVVGALALTTAIAERFAGSRA